MNDNSKKISEEEIQSQKLINYMRHEDFTSSINLSKKLIKIYPENFDFYNILALSYKQSYN